MFVEPIHTTEKKETLTTTLNQLHKGDRLLIYSFQDLNMSLLQINQLLQYLQVQQITFCSVAEELDTRSMAGQKFLLNLQLLAEHELAHHKN